MTPALRPWLAFAMLPSLLAQTPATPAPAPEVKWRGGIWASGAASNRQTPDGSLFLRGMDAGEGQLALDGLELGADVTLPQGWAFKVTLLAGQDAKVLAAASGETGSVTYPEAMLVWTGTQDVLRFGRMYTFMGMEYLDQIQNVTASRGLLFTYAIPFNQVGLAWRHSFSPAWSTDLWVFNGENRIRDNNRGKTAGLGLNYNHGGSQEKYVSLMAYLGPEQDGLGSAAHQGAEGRKRTRVCALAGWAWGDTTLLGEAEWAKETFAAAAIAGAPASGTEAHWSGLGVILKRRIDDRWSAFLRLETMKDDRGVALLDPTIAAAPGLSAAEGADLRATSGCLGLERKWGPTFARLEVREDRLNKAVPDQDQHLFRSATSLTLSLGTAF
jgi:hypothetical protein